MALYAQRRPADVTIYGDFTTGYIVTPSLPTDFRTAPDAGRRARARR
ncbi:RelA/SpoT domain-containing protein [Mycobacterium tuberculosis]|uniref:RelA/SpoT domain-containing protein n=1 Tax=Mycobacterium tuberculosis TaxID=1773 RepID=A0A916LGP4_MYCTX|nr:RelA/SpoT domain-containing protein [Mycobacterium tuberculosis]